MPRKQYYRFCCSKCEHKLSVKHGSRNYFYECAIRGSVSSEVGHDCTDFARKTVNQAFVPEYGGTVAGYLETVERLWL